MLDYRTDLRCSIGAGFRGGSDGTLKRTKVPHEADDTPCAELS